MTRSFASHLVEFVLEIDRPLHKQVRIDRKKDRLEVEPSIVELVSELRYSFEDDFEQSIHSKTWQITIMIRHLRN